MIELTPRGLKRQSKFTNAKFDQDFCEQKVLKTGKFLIDTYKNIYPKNIKYLTNFGSIFLDFSAFLFTVLVNWVMEKTEKKIIFYARAKVLVDFERMISSPYLIVGSRRGEI